PATGPQQMQRCMPSRSFCYGCSREVTAHVQPDLELQCPECGSNCLESLRPSQVSSSSDAPWQNVPPPGPGVSLMGPGFPSLGLSPSPGPMMGPMGPMGPMGGLGQMAMPPIGPSPIGSMGMPLSPSPMGLPAPLAPLAAPLAPLSGDVARLMGLGPALAHAMHLRHSRRRRHQGPISAGGLRHFGVICDGCSERDFQGTRYRCTSCQDYDLCSSCHAQRSQLHPDHSFEAIQSPRLSLPQSLADQLQGEFDSAGRTVFAILEVGFEPHEDAEMYSGLDDSKISWWLAEDRRLLGAGAVAAQDPDWSCPICSDGLEPE
ncbi:unnamed protein product, partial [Effrenium voratum]